MKKKIIPALAAVLAISGCATKHYGRQGELTTYERDTMSCREIALEKAKTTGFVERVNKESAFDGRDVLAILGDFGIGNAMEQSAARESAASRAGQLDALWHTKGCGTTAQAAPTVVAPPAVAVAASGAMSWQVEKMARQAGCAPAAQAALIAKTDAVETYQVTCEGGQQALFKCEARQCRILN